VAGLAGLAVLGGAWVTMALRDGIVRQRQFAAGRVPLRVSNPLGAHLTLWRAGSTVGSATEVPLPAGEAWLESASYYVEATLGDRRFRYPVPLAGFHRGPDEDGAFAITVRPVVSKPPQPDTSPPGFVPVPSGYVALGDPKNPGERHFAWVPAFHAAMFEVTNGEFRRFLADPDGHRARANWTGAGWAWREATPSASTAALRPGDPDFERFGLDDQPVVLVSWFEANAFACWATRRAGGAWTFRLPTEAEWEKAARGPESFDYGLGMQLSEPEADLYNWRKNPGAAVTVVGTAATPGQYRPNGFGLYHVSGNVAEWLQSAARPYNRERPYRDDDRNHDEGSSLRTTRGGSWYSATTSRLLLAYREEFQPELRSNDLGFRLVAVRQWGVPAAADR
jgi:formylglycine-generating enzyme required for sulfatase activity